MSGKIGEGWRNCRRFMGLLWDRKKSVVVTMFLFALLGSVVTVLGVYMPKFMLQTLLCHDSRRFLIGLAVFCGVTAGITFGNCRAQVFSKPDRHC
ncbi:MAG: hypothetical protein HFI38_03640 [Lachnospiraceae bacterium]|jgi:F0F1-type ATP synthase membrane subunit c/vacuolar-type H+-ATPase subunit K|nr:hypothetical protein [Lachnospiraceae bacterium]